MKERALILGGHLRIDSEVGGGTTGVAIFPRPARAKGSSVPYALRTVLLEV